MECCGRLPLGAEVSGLGHDMTTIKDLARDERVTGLTITGGLEFKTSDCESCQISKATRLTFNDVSIRGTGPLEIVHSDVAGPVRPSTSGMRYYVTIIDDFTRITLLRAMEKKSEVLGHLQKCITLLENALNTKVKVIRTDGGGEYSGERWNRWTQEKGLVHQITPAYTPQLNGVAERMNRTVKEMIAANLIGAKMGGEHWVFAMKWTEAMLMRTRVGSDGKMPWEVLWKRRPSMEDVHPFGCEAWVRIPEANRERGDMAQARAEKGRLVGLPAGTSGWAIWLPLLQKVVFSRDVTFRTPSQADANPSPREEVTEQVEQVPVPEEPLDDQPSSGEQVTEEVEERAEPEVVAEEGGAEPEEVQADQPAPVPAEPVPFQPRRSERVRAPRVMIADGKVNIASNDEIFGWMLSATAALDDDPKTYEQAMASPLKRKWEEAVSAELRVIEKAGTWEEAVLPEGRRIVGCKWVFKTKRDQDGAISKHKARIVAKGYSQVPGQDFEETYSPVARLTSLRIFFTIVATEDLATGQVDVISAFLNGELTVPIYMEIPLGYRATNRKANCVKLLKALYGLKQAGRTWWEALDKQLAKLGFERCAQDWGVYVRKGSKPAYLVVYVDDMLVAAKDQATVDDIKRELARRWEMTDAGEVTFMLRLRVSRDTKERTIVKVWGSCVWKQATFFFTYNNASLCL